MLGGDSSCTSPDPSKKQLRGGKLESSFEEASLKEPPKEIFELEGSDAAEPGRKK